MSRYVFYGMNLNDKTSERKEFQSVVEAVRHFCELSPSKSTILTGDEESFIYCIKNEQGWVADKGNKTNGIYNVLYKDKPGILEHFLKHSYNEEEVRKILNRAVNLEKLLNE